MQRSKWIEGLREELQMDAALSDGPDSGREKLVLRT